MIRIKYWTRGWPKGKPRSRRAKSEAHKAAISAALKGKPKSPESVAKMRATLTGRKLTPEHVLLVKEGIKRASLSNPHLMVRDTSGSKNGRWIADRQEAALRKKIARKYLDLLKYALRGVLKEGHSEDLVGYGTKELRVHLESLFTPGMSWQNYGTSWHIDHVRPLGTFPLDTPPRIVNALSNLRPLWSKLNLKRPKDGRDIYVKS